MKASPFKTALLAAAALTVTVASANAEITACLITKTDINPFFVKMKEGASAKAEELGINLDTFAGKIDGDVETQVAVSRPASPAAPRAS